MRPNLHFFSLIGTSGGKVLGWFSNLEMIYCSSSGVIDNFGLGTGFFGGYGGNRTDIGVRKLMGGRDL